MGSISSSVFASSAEPSGRNWCAAIHDTTRPLWKIARECHAPHPALPSGNAFPHPKTKVKNGAKRNGSSTRPRVESVSTHPPVGSSGCLGHWYVVHQERQNNKCTTDFVLRLTGLTESIATLPPCHGCIHGMVVSIPIVSLSARLTLSPDDVHDASIVQLCFVFCFVLLFFSFPCRPLELPTKTLTTS